MRTILREYQSGRNTPASIASDLCQRYARKIPWKMLQKSAIQRAPPCFPSYISRSSSSLVTRVSLPPAHGELTRRCSRNHFQRSSFLRKFLFKENRNEKTAGRRRAKHAFLCFPCFLYSVFLSSNVEVVCNMASRAKGLSLNCVRLSGYVIFFNLIFNKYKFEK